MDKVDALDKYGRGKVANPFNHEGAPDSYRDNFLDPFIARLKKENQSPVVLDLASGLGDTAAYLEQKGVKVTRLDISLESLQEGGADKIRALLGQLPIKEGAFDAVHFKDALVHTADPVILFKELNRILKPGGEVLITTAETLHDIPKFRIRSEKTGQSMGMAFADEADYVKKMNDVNKLGLMEKTRVTPPYYPVRESIIRETAKKAGFYIDSIQEWTPTAYDNDWYNPPMKRLVVSMTKNH